jgi:hypothetical protein
MHTAPMKDSEGTFNEWRLSEVATCWKCTSDRVEYRVWESNCGGYEDNQYRCIACGEQWWVEGIDS